ncbi:MAG: hypothetical protein IJ191_08965 [Treponema sp.]|nr:hypothetical protein [Treponema sp.]
MLVDILCRFYFERSVFDARAHGELSAPEFCHLMRAAQEKSYGSGLNDERHEYLWAVKSHYYDTALDFYNFPYAFGQLFAIGLYEQFRAEGSSFVQTYEKLLSETGTLTSEAVCALAGFDSADPSFWKRSIAYYEEEIATITAYAASL